MNQRLLGAFAALLALLGTTALGYWTGKENGIAEGIDSYHKICYNVGGYVVDQGDGSIVACQPLTQLSEPELKNFLD